MQKNEIIAIFDAEDRPYKDIYKIVNTVFVKENVNVVQSGVQLINFDSRWFSIMNVMEYFFWFKSGLHFFTNIGKVTPLAGNSVFIEKIFLNKVKGWKENILTEDADIGFRLTNIGAKIKVIYDEGQSTLEETPHTVNAFIKQRTRWNQGFMQIFLEGNWLSFPLKRQRIIAAYILLSPISQSILAFYMPVSTIIEFTTKFPVPLAMFSLLPFYLFVFQIFLYIVGFWKYKEKFVKTAPFWIAGKILLVFYFYQILIAISAFRALLRMLSNNNNWEKTIHLNAHHIAANKILAYE